MDTHFSDSSQNPKALFTTGIFQGDNKLFILLGVIFFLITISFVGFSMIGPSGKKTQVLSASATITPTLTPTDTPTPTDIPTPQIKSTSIRKTIIYPTNTPVPSATATPTQTPTPTMSQTPTDTPTPTSKITPTDTPTETPAPSDTPAPEPSEKNKKAYVSSEVYKTNLLITSATPSSSTVGAT